MSAGLDKSSFEGLRVAAFESRRAEELARMITKRGGLPFVSPSMREIASEKNQAAIDFANRLITGRIDVIVFLTGVGTRILVEQVVRHVDRERFLAAISDIKSVVRGPKPLAALRELGITPTLTVPEPNTWRELLTTLDEHLPVANLVVGLQEYGVTNPSLIAGLEARGAVVDVVHVYDWALPEDCGPLEANIRRMAAGEVDVAMFTSGNQVLNLLKLADDLGLADDLRSAFRGMVVASIGPTTSEKLRSQNLPVDLEPSHPKMGHLVQETAERAGEMLARKRRIAQQLSNIQSPPAGSSSSPAHVEMRRAAGGGDGPARESETRAPDAAWRNGAFMRACRRESMDFTPIWLMRQAGRYMPEYRRIREQHSFLELCRNPQLCSEIMCTAVERLGVDAAIVFSDLLPILEPMGMELEFAHGEGPLIHNPLRESSDVDRVVELESADVLHFVMEAVRQTRADLPANIPLIGFAGAPFTLASYAIEGGASRSYLHTKTLMYRDAAAWNELMGRLSRAIVVYLNAQIAAGAGAVQLFDSWVGCLGPEDYRQYALPFVGQIIDGITPGVPVISFSTGNPQLTGLLAEAAPAVVGVDWRVRLDDAWQMAGHDRAIQGNLDPTALLAGRNEIRRRAADILQQAAGRPGHIFNLGHGVLPQTPVDNARALVDIVHEL
ncbi:MAG TPA: uroporphyrinogen decarboxylase, partial [Lacipirellulaceae bacterium]|nr:uroporphyrinogen decarboxylase [Lacipirellulaceae bacterium]